ncbi:hypothetical protein [Undibacterium sp. Xuan67W]|uniref:hypothetical protein n=1 Tax=Undibacterium sp. Xuan67W TaxID=3413057 RepID=UPI003BF547BB
MPDYVIGKSAPRISPDPGSGQWCSETQTANFLVYKRALEMAMDTHAVDVTIGVDAVKHMRHYMNNTGNDYMLDMADLLKKSSQLKQKYEADLALAKTFVKNLADGEYDITSQKLGHGYFYKSQDINLFFAIGGYSFWGQGKVNISSQKGITTYVLDFEFHFYDRYNWDGGKSVTIAGIQITDAFMQKFHRQCYAKEFDVRGLFKQTMSWTENKTAEKNNPPAKKPLSNPFESLMK